ncbi:MAG: stage II sporulation protein P [Oliverpabstia sp.]|nr:stage II sporulation protein P [Oliverpabstia sp.]
MTRSEKVIQAILWCAAVLLGGYLGARGYMKLREDPPETCKEILRWAYGEVGEEYLSCYLPGSLYEEGENTSVAERMWERLQKEIPLYTYLKENEPVKTVVEDESTCQEIITANGQTITERLLAENQGKAVTEENENARENKETQEEEGKEKENTESVKEEINEETKEQVKEETQEEVPSQMPAWTSAVEVSPVKDLSMEQLSDFNYLLNNFFVVDPNTTIDSSQMDAASLLGDDLKLTGGSENPQILIYHTHSQEGYVDSVEGDENTSVIGVGNYLESILRDIFGYQVIHIKDTFDIVDGQLDRSKAYNYALPVVEQVLAENPSIEVVIDLHRDGVPEDKHLVTEINGKPTAQIMFFNGLSRTVNNGNLDSLPNPYISDNLAFSFQLSYQAARYYPHFTRCIYLKGYRYNLHVRPRSILLEVGAQTNTVEEAMNAMEPFSVILDKVLKGE